MVQRCGSFFEAQDATYSPDHHLLVSILGLVLIPGQEPGGGVYYLSFLDAFFVVSYTATTIGFGEIPHPFTAQQKMWMLFVMYSTVIAFQLYATGSVLSVISDPVSVGLHAHQRTVGQIQAHKQPFWIVCGYGGAVIK